MSTPLNRSNPLPNLLHWAARGRRPDSDDISLAAQQTGVGVPALQAAVDRVAAIAAQGRHDDARDEADTQAERLAAGWTDAQRAAVTPDPPEDPEDDLAAIGRRMFDR